MSKIVTAKDKIVNFANNHDQVYFAGLIVVCVAGSVAAAYAIDKIFPVKEENE